MMRIAITGKLRSGKTSISDYLERAYEYKRIAFGDALKRYAHEIFGEVENKPRELYQSFGQKMREIDSDVWVKQVERVINEWESVTNYSVVIDDLRQPNEYEWARDNGFTIIRINADKDVRIKRAEALGDDFDEENLSHDTESHVDKFEVDYDFVNNTTEDFIKITDKLDAVMLYGEDTHA